MKQKFFFTFGQDHTHRYDSVTLDCDSVVQINAETEEHARIRMVDAFGMKWGFSYSEERMEESLKKYYPRGVVLVLEG
jgi:hypothetical protein